MIRVARLDLSFPPALPLLLAWAAIAVIGCDSAASGPPAAQTRAGQTQAGRAPSATGSPGGGGGQTGEQPSPPTGGQGGADSPEPPSAEPSEPQAPLVRARVKLVVLGSFPDELAAAVEESLRRELDVEVERIDGVPLPRFAYYEPRRRYRAERLLSFLNQRLAGEPASTRVLGLTSVDISTTKGPHRDWGVFGLGELGGRSCVISSFRLRRRARDDAHVTFRVATTAVHEVGHTLGLEHCTEPSCLMRDAEGSIETVDSSTAGVGPGCLRRLDRMAPRSLRPP